MLSSYKQPSSIQSTNYIYILQNFIMTISNTPRVFSLLCLALSVAGQWTGNYNTTAVPRGQDPASHCWIQSLAQTPYTAIYPCTCTGGKVGADCNWQDALLFNSVRDATCKCATTGDLTKETEALKAFGQSSTNAVKQCLCDPATPEGKPGADGLVVPSPNCWCPASSLKESSGLTEAKEGQASPEAPAPVDAAAVQKCRDDFNKSSMIKKNACDQLAESKDPQFSDPMQRNLPNCTPALLKEVCKTI